MIRASLARAKGDLSAVGAIEASALRKTLDKAGYGELFAEASRNLALETAQDYAAERAKLAQLSPAERLSYALERALDSGLGQEILAAGASIPSKGGRKVLEDSSKLTQDGRKVEESLTDAQKTSELSKSEAPGEASKPVHAVRLQNRVTAQEIAGGHAFEKHLSEFSELGIRTRTQFCQSH